MKYSGPGYMIKAGLLEKHLLKLVGYIRRLL